MGYQELITQLDKAKLPRHIGVIMDGNGRWAKKHSTTRLNGHKQGVRALREVVEASVEIGLEYLTIYAFSTENWKRTEQEVHGLLKLIMDTLMHEIDEVAKNNIAIRFIGSKQGLSEEYYKRIIEHCSRSWNNTGLHFNVAMNYGGRQEIVEAVREIVTASKEQGLSPEEIDSELIGQYLYTKDIPDPDLLIRTSSEYRLSNFLVWQAAYSELWFTDTLWPDFEREEYIKAILDYQKRQRRFGAY